MAKDEKVEYTDSTAKRDLDARLNNPGPAPVAPHKDYVNPDNSAVLVNDHEDGEGVFVGVSPEYANAANETDAPLQADEGPDAAAEEAFEDSYGDSSGVPSDAVKEALGEVAPHRPEVEEPAPAPAPVEETTTETEEDNQFS